MAVFPDTTKRWALMAIPLNLVPGVGTMVASGNRDDLRPFYIGLAQLLVFLLAVALGVALPLVAGGLFIADLAWAIVWAVLGYTKAA